ncbi:acetamidase [Ophiostoma piceae UAMH 11346]|uniref:Acetamidase n=1 Tax=Ophiostoma piceae (strain UAMH 11346) TaxID=1262450 RepID=S3BS68_OPHP1|nr:acetamidase [Ophiostoma piceae UAMH 11346]
MSQQSWLDVVDRKLAQRAKALSRFADVKVTTAITDEHDIESLRTQISAGDVTVEEVVADYIAKSYAAHKVTNCKSFTEIIFADALERAKELDKIAKEDRSKLPLFGVPVTLKDQFDVAGYDSTIGYVGRAFSPAEEDGALVKILKSQGAVILAKTNLPQSIMWCETENPMFGLTVNPFDPNYTPGGSTGGESALLASHGSLLGWGTDIGGSIRIPSHMMGLYGLKPTSCRLPYRGVPVSTDGQEHVPSSVGPLARSLNSIYIAMKAVIDAEPWQHDSRCAPVPWRSNAYDDAISGSRSLVFGVLRFDGVVQPHPPVARVLDETVSKLKAAGHHVVEWDASLHAELVAVMDAFYSADGGEDIRRDVARGGEPFIPHVARLVDRGPAISVYEYWQLNKRKLTLQNAYLDKWNSLLCEETGTAVDAVILPPMPHTAVPHKSCAWVGYTKVWNVLDYPALVLPAGKVSSEDLAVPWTLDEAEAKHPMDVANIKLWTKHGARMADLELPVGIQLVCRRLEEEKLIGIGKVVDSILKS